MKKNRGFTLVELIVVLVILAILASILTPALLGYIDKARDKKHIMKAKACMTAAQAVFTEAYGKGYPIANKNVLGLGATSNSGNHGDIICVGTDVEKAVKNYVDDDPYIFLVAVGSCVSGSNATTHEKYIVDYAIYVPEKDARPYYYYNGVWSTANATNVGVITKGTNTNKLITNGKSKDIQYYIICNKEKTNYTSIDDNINSKSFWGYLRKSLPKKYGDPVMQ